MGLNGWRKASRVFSGERLETTALQNEPKELTKRTCKDNDASRARVNNASQTPLGSLHVFSNLTF
jgi:hypothetical protein